MGMLADSLNSSKTAPKLNCFHALPAPAGLVAESGLLKELHRHLLTLRPPPREPQRERKLPFQTPQLSNQEKISIYRGYVFHKVLGTIGVLNRSRANKWKACCSCSWHSFDNSPCHSLPQRTLSTDSLQCTTCAGWRTACHNKIYIAAECMLEPPRCSPWFSIFLSATPAWKRHHSMAKLVKPMPCPICLQHNYDYYMPEASLQTPGAVHGKLLRTFTGCGDLHR